jgi:hypothetical protein
MRLHDDDCQAAEDTDTFLYLSFDGPGFTGPFFVYWTLTCNARGDERPRPYLRCGLANCLGFATR